MHKVVIVGGARTPFIRFNTLFQDIPAYELGRVALTEALYRSGVRPSQLDEVVFGNIANPPEASNISRVIALLAQVPERIPAFTVSRNCSSGIESIIQACYKIALGEADFIAAGGVESMSNIPLFFKKGAQKKFTALGTARTMGKRLGVMASFRPKDFGPVIGLLKGLTDYNAGLNMGETAELLAKEFHITRDEQDAFALQSHQRASASTKSGRLARETVPVALPPRYAKWADEDNGIRHEQSMVALAKLRPVFDRKYGSVTAGNASQITDGASCLIVTSEEKAQAEGLPIWAEIKGFATAALDPARMGLGPAYAIPKLLGKVGMEMKDVDILEVNEAFASQYLACEKALDSEEWCRDNLGRPAPGAPPRDKTNVNGGAIALGHPVGASANRLVLTLCHELREKGLSTGLASLCVGGGQGAAMMVQRREP